MPDKIRTNWSLPPSPTQDERPSFAELPASRPKSGLSFLYSLGVHAVAIGLLGSTVQSVRARKELLTHEAYPTRTLQLAPITWNPRPTETARRREPGPSLPGGRIADGPTSIPAAAAAPAESGNGGQAEANEGKHFQLPTVAARKPASQVLVRLDIPPDIKLNPKVVVPEVLLWQLKAATKPQDELIAAAHREEQPVRRREMTLVKPQLNARNREQELAELRHAAEPPVPVPALPLLVANTTPIRLLDGVAGTKLPNSTGPVVSAPEAVHVISVPDVPVPQARVIVLPPGNQGATPPAPAGSHGQGTGQGSANDGRTPGASSDNQRRGMGAGGNGTSTSSKELNPPRNSGGGGTAGSTGESGGQGSSNSLDARPGGGGGASGQPNGTGVIAGSGNGGTGAAPAGSIRIDRPKDGKFSVVVLGSSNLDAYPEVAGILSGKLVYTVYIRAGGKKEWILQYCLSKSAEQSVKLRGSTVALEAPYPFLMYRPQLNLQNDPDYIIVHGFINAAGKFEHLSAIGDLDAAGKDLLIGTLDHWVFRPASREGEPSAVEIALIIPREPI